MKIFNEQHEMKSAGASTAPSEASPRTRIAPAKPALDRVVL